MDVKTSRRHLARAVQLLGTGEGSMVDRLRAAYDGGLRHVAPHAGLPEHLRPTFDALTAAIADLLKLKTAGDDRAAGLARGIVMLYDRLGKNPDGAS